MTTLNELGVKHQTDKSSLNHHYLDLYDIIFTPKRYEPILFLEIGVQFGNSIKTWREYFPNATIVGLDVVDHGPISGTTIHTWDAYVIESAMKLSVLQGKFDIIVDDGSHSVEDQMFVVENYVPLLADGGILIIEDVPHKDAITRLASVLPRDFIYTAVDMTQGGSIIDSRLFLTWKKPSEQ